MKAAAIQEWEDWSADPRAAAMVKIPGYEQTARSSTLAPAATAEDIIFPAMPTTIKAKIIKQAHREKTWKAPGVQRDGGKTSDQ